MANGRIWNEVEPILSHAVVTVIVLAVVLVVGGACVIAEAWLPQQKEAIEWIEHYDVLFAQTLLTLFAVSSILLILIRIGRNISQEFKN